MLRKILFAAIVVGVMASPALAKRHKKKPTPTPTPSARISNPTTRPD